MVKEIEASYRVYVKEWILEFSSAKQDSAERSMQSRFEGRLKPEDIKIIVTNYGAYAVYCRRWNVNSEWKTEGLAEVWAKALRELRGKSDVMVVARNSKQEHELLNYGKVMLPSND